MSSPELELIRGEHTYRLGDYVRCDEAIELELKITGFLIRREDAPQIECTYWMNGEQKQVWIPVWRLRPDK